MSAAFWKVFELAISVWENILLLEFCMDFMQQKPRGKKGKVLWGIAVLFGLIFPALEKYPALYDRWEMWITLIWLFVYLMVGTFPTQERLAQIALQFPTKFYLFSLWVSAA